jgi:phosphoglycolate phosphatase-like HAD superfamily hydrolase
VDRADAAERLDELVANWPALLQRFAEDHAPVYLRRRAEASAALRRFQAAGYRIGAFTDAPEPLARVAVEQLGAARRLDVLEAGRGARERLLAALGDDTVVVTSQEELARVP